MNKKPIIQAKGTGNYRYKNCFAAYTLNIPIEFETDLSEEQFAKLIDGGLTGEDIEIFETIGSF